MREKNRLIACGALHFSPFSFHAAICQFFPPPQRTRASVLVCVDHTSAVLALVNTSDSDPAAGIIVSYCPCANVESALLIRGPHETVFSDVRYGSRTPAIVSSPGGSDTMWGVLEPYRTSSKTWAHLGPSYCSRASALEQYEALDEPRANLGSKRRFGERAAGTISR